MFFFSHRTVVVPRVTKFYTKNRSNKLFFSEKLCYSARAFLAEDNWFIFERILKMKVNKRTNVYL